MKLTKLLLLTVISVITFSFTLSPVVYNVDIKQSKVQWIGKKVTGQHEGFVKIANGQLTFDGNLLKGGKFDIDMTSITCTDIKDSASNAKLIGHLKSNDFFGTEAHPKAQFLMTEAVPAGANNYTIKGRLTIKDHSYPVELPATVTQGKDDVKAKAKLMVDRTKFDIKYGSKSFMDNLGDKAIDDEFELNIDLVAKKQ